LGTKYSSALGLQYTNKEGKQHDVLMGSYGIGIGRVMGTIVEASHDKDGIIWTKNTSPYHLHLLNLSKNDQADKIYTQIQKQGLEVLFDDRDISFGKKLKDADLIGIPWQLIVSDKQAELELVSRSDHKKQMVSFDQALKIIKQFY
ncbi:proline--tRNA ligase, partial [bacterium]|nr:proline--tRNA ligase [bacterium]